VKSVYNTRTSTVYFRQWQTIGNSLLQATLLSDVMGIKVLNEFREDVASSTPQLQRLLKATVPHLLISKPRIRT
jgi:hypothetical protein